MRAKLANLNNCAVLFLSRADANLCWYIIFYYFSNQLDCLRELYKTYDTNKTL